MQTFNIFRTRHIPSPDAADKKNRRETYWVDYGGKFNRNSTEICRKIQDNQRLMKNFHQVGKMINLRAKLCAFGPKMRNFEIFQENFAIF